MADDRPRNELGVPFPSRRELVGPWRRVVTADSLEEALRAIRMHGWTPALVGVLAHVLVRGAATYAFDPVVVGQGYAFPGWPIALVVNTVYALIYALLGWILYFGAITIVARQLAPGESLQFAVLKVGGYLSVLFVPTFLVGIVLGFSLAAGDYSIPETALNNSTRFARAVFELRGRISATPQMWLLRGLRVATWGVLGFAVLPVTQRLYGLSERRSVLVVLPVTFLAMYTTFLMSGTV